MRFTTPPRAACRRRGGSIRATRRQRSWSASARLQIARGAPPVYDRAALSLTDAERAALAADGRKPHWRFKLEPEVVRWDDLVRGDSHIDCASLSDPVLVREDGSYLYTLPSVVDDIDVGRHPYHPRRGPCHQYGGAGPASSGRWARQKAPHFAHHNLLIGADGQGLSKRTGALSIASLREAGVELLAVAAMAALTGSSIAVQPVHSLPELAGLFDLSAMSRNSARFDEAELRRCRSACCMDCLTNSVRDRLAAHDIVGFKAEPLWLAARGNLTHFSDIAEWWGVVESEITVTALPEDLHDAALKTLPPEPLGRDHLGRLDLGDQGSDGAQGQGLVPSPAARPDRPRSPGRSLQSSCR